MDIDTSAPDALLEQTARLLGADFGEARRLGRQSALIAGGMPVAMVELPPGGGQPAGFMLCVDSGRPVAADTGKVAMLLMQAPGLLLEFGIVLGSSTRGTWTLFRFVPGAWLDAPTLAREIKTLRRMADLSLLRAVAAPH